MSTAKAIIKITIKQQKQQKQKKKE